MQAPGATVSKSKRTMGKTMTYSPAWLSIPSRRRSWTNLFRRFLMFFRKEPRRPNKAELAADFNSQLHALVDQAQSDGVRLYDLVDALEAHFAFAHRPR
jgi:hypothetical protein